MYLSFALRPVSFSILPKEGWGGRGGQNEIVWIIGGTNSVCKACGKLGGSGGMLPKEILILELLLDTIWWNLGVFAQTLPFIVSLKLYN